MQSGPENEEVTLLDISNFSQILPIFFFSLEPSSLWFKYILKTYHGSIL